MRSWSSIWDAFIASTHPWFLIHKIDPIEPHKSEKYKSIRNPRYEEYRVIFDNLKARFRDILKDQEIVDLYLVLTQARKGCLISSSHILDFSGFPLGYYMKSKGGDYVEYHKTYSYYITSPSLYEEYYRLKEMVPSCVELGRFLGYPCPDDLRNQSILKGFMLEFKELKYMLGFKVRDDLTAKEMVEYARPIQRVLSYIYPGHLRIEVYIQ